MAACVLALLATACVDIEMDFVFRDDKSGSSGMSMRVDEAVLGFAALGEGGSSEDLCQQMADDAGFDNPLGLSDIDVEQSVDVGIEDGDCVITALATWTADAGDAVLAELTEEDGPSVRRFDGGGWRFELDMGTFEEETSAADLSQITAMGFDAPTMTFSVTLPGDAVEHNADTVSQSKYTWELPFDALDELPESLYVETAPGGGGLGPAAIGGIIAGVVLALAALVTLRRHREAGAAESVDAEPDSEPTDGQDPETADEASDSDEASDDAANGDSLEPDDGDDDPAGRPTET